jgi:hypothetical protein
VQKEKTSAKIKTRNQIINVPAVLELMLLLPDKNWQANSNRKIRILNSGTWLSLSINYL